MELLNYWTRQEVIKISNLTRGQFQVFESLELVHPLKFSVGKSGLVLYNWDQLLIIKAYSKLREQASLQSIREAITYLSKYEFTEAMLNKDLIVYKNELCWADTNEEMKDLIQVSGKDRGQFIMSFNIQDLVKEMIVMGKECKIVDFEERFKQSMQRVHAA